MSHCSGSTASDLWVLHHGCLANARMKMVQDARFQSSLRRIHGAMVPEPKHQHGMSKTPWPRHMSTKWMWCMLRPAPTQPCLQALPLKRDKVLDKLSGSSSSMSVTGRPFHPVASWGTLSIPVGSVVSTPRASFANLSGLEEAAAVAAAAIGRTPSPSVRCITPSRILQAMGSLSHRQIGQSPAEAAGGLMTSAQVRRGRHTCMLNVTVRRMCCR